jgi:hypothetical protein
VSSPAETTTYLRPPSSADARDTSAEEGIGSPAECTAESDVEVAGAARIAAACDGSEKRRRAAVDGAGEPAAADGAGQGAALDGADAGAAVEGAGRGMTADRDGTVDSADGGAAVESAEAGAAVDSVGDGGAVEDVERGASGGRAEAEPDGPSTAILPPLPPAPATIPALPLAPRDPADRPFAHPQRSTPGKPNSLWGRLFRRT